MLALTLASPVLANPPFDIQPNVTAIHPCETSQAVDSVVVNVTEISSSATADPSPSGLVTGTSIETGTATNSRIFVTIDPDSDAFDRSGRSYRVEIIPTYSATGNPTYPPCVVRVNVKQVDV